MSARAEPLTVGVRADQDTVLGGDPDLGCGYAAVSTAGWLGAGWELASPGPTVEYVLSLHRAGGGYAPATGLPAQLWSTFMSTAMLRDLGVGVPQPAETVSWLSGLRDEGGFGMTPGQPADAWATYHGCRVATESCGITVPRDGLARWLQRLQAPGGGLAASPAAADADRADLGATFAAVSAWQVAAPGDPHLPWRASPLVRWLRGRQRRGGGFTLTEPAERSCLTATHYALAALAALGAGPVDREACLRWVLDRQGPRGSFLRWEGYEVEDVWAAHHGVAALRLLGHPVAGFRQPVLYRLAEAACPGGGFTYREASLAADTLGTALTLILGEGPAVRARDWLCELQGDQGGIPRLPGGDPELRATQWTACAGVLGDSRRRVRAVRWLTGRQNPDGGFGPWAGRGSELTATVDALELDSQLGYEGARVDRTAATGFLLGRRDAEPGLLAALRAARGLALGGAPEETIRPAVERALAEHASPSGGYADRPGGIPDLVTSYEVVLTAPRLGVRVDPPGLLYTLDALRRPDGFAWTQAATGCGGPLAYGLGSLLEEALLADLHWPVPPLTLG